MTEPPIMITYLIRWEGGELTISPYRTPLRPNTDYQTVFRVQTTRTGQLFCYAWATGRPGSKWTEVDEKGEPPYMLVYLIAEKYRRETDPLRLMPETFTILELRQMHEAIMGHALMKDTFRRRVIGDLVPVDSLVSICGGRPAQVYRMAEDLDQ